MSDNAIQIGKRIKARREELNYTQEDLGKALNMNKSTIQRYENGKVEKIKLPVIQAMASFLHVSPEWLILKDNSPTEPSPDPNAELYAKYPNIKPITTRRIPMLGEIACGKPIFVDEDRESYVEVGTDIKADFCMRAHGDSMINARILDGDIVFVRTQDMVNDGEIAVVVIDDEATLKRVYYDRENNVLTLVAENPKYRPFVYSGEELEHIRILGKAVAFESGL